MSVREIKLRYAPRQLYDIVNYSQEIMHGDFKSFNSIRQIQNFEKVASLVLWQSGTSGAYVFTEIPKALVIT